MTSFYTFQPYRFLELADYLVDNSTHKDEECRFRTAAGRAYYAAFLITYKKMQDFGSLFRDKQHIHRETIEALQKYDSGLSSKLNTLFDIRVDADYNMDVKIGRGRSLNCLKLSQRIIKQVIDLQKK
jgi:hypothetical protein